MPTIRISAMEASKLPSQIMMMTWIEEWEAQRPGTWGGAQYKGDFLTVAVQGPAVGQIEAVVSPTINSYNQTHTGNDTLTYGVSG